MTDAFELRTDEARFWIPLAFGGEGGTLLDVQTLIWNGVSTVADPAAKEAWERVRSGEDITVIVSISVSKRERPKEVEA